MCAIAGLFGPHGIDTGFADVMARSLAHRGPDAHNVEYFGADRPYAALGIERLAIVDVKQGHQPASDPSGRWWVVLNGEIYNHGELRAELSHLGVTTRTQSDTEVFAALTACLGVEQALERCHGMFALAVLDTKERRLYLIRDRMGVKPLHWAKLPDGGVGFGSELKALLAHPEVSRDLDEVAIQSFLVFEYIPTPKTPYRHIHKVEPGTWVEVDAAGIRTHRWWHSPQTPGGRPGELGELGSEVREVFEHAVHLRMDADVPVAYLLSGGLDSGAVTTVAQRRSTVPLHSFALQVVGEGYDDSVEAKESATDIGTHHHLGRIGPEDLAPTLNAITEVIDEPLADSSLLAYWRLMEMVREHGFKCVQSGDGADETFAGYPTYAAHRLARLARPFSAPLGWAVNRLPTRYEGVTIDYKAKRFALGLPRPWPQRHQIWMGAWLDSEIAANPAIWEPVEAHAAMGGRDTIGRVLYLDQRLYLGDCVLVKVDRASGAHGVEVRSPFMDFSMVEVAARIGTGHHYRGFTGKQVLRHAFEGIVPQTTRLRKKKGFGVPTGPWLRGPCTSLLDGLPERLADWVPPDLHARCIDEHRSGRADHRRRLWSAVVLDHWMRGPFGPS